MTYNPKATGEKTQAIVIAELIKRNYVVLLPFGDNQRYDLVIDNKDKFLRVQCKTGRLRKGAILFNASSTRINANGYKITHYNGQIDLFAVYSPELDKVYLIPVDDTPQGKWSRTTFLRIDVPKNNQLSGIRWAKDYEL